MHFVLPWYETILFDKSAQLYKLDELNIFTTNKLSVKTSWIIYYFLEYVCIILFKPFNIKIDENKTKQQLKVKKNSANCIETLQTSFDP